MSTVREARPQMLRWQAVRFYDASIDGEAVRISGFSDRGGEFWVRQPLCPTGQSRRLQREKAVAAIEAAIRSGGEPGEVVMLSQ